LSNYRKLTAEPAEIAEAIILEAVSKNGFWFNIKAAARFKPEEYWRILRI